jgi:hypothetical protein
VYRGVSTRIGIVDEGQMGMHYLQKKLGWAGILLVHALLSTLTLFGERMLSPSDRETGTRKWKTSLK